MKPRLDNVYLRSALRALDCKFQFKLVQLEKKWTCFVQIFLYVCIVVSIINKSLLSIDVKSCFLCLFCVRGHVLCRPLNIRHNSYFLLSLDSLGLAYTTSAAPSNRFVSFGTEAEVTFITIHLLHRYSRKLLNECCSDDILARGKKGAYQESVLELKPERDLLISISKD